MSVCLSLPRPKPLLPPGKGLERREVQRLATHPCETAGEKGEVGTSFAVPPTTTLLVPLHMERQPLHHKPVPLNSHYPDLSRMPSKPDRQHRQSSVLRVYFGIPDRIGTSLTRTSTNDSSLVKGKEYLYMHIYIIICTIYVHTE